MTRPMPGPPEDCYCRDGNATCDDCETYGYRYSWGLCPGCHLHNGRDLGAHKRLKDAECAAEYWRAEAEEADARGRSWFYEDPATVNAERVKASLAANRARTWHRFARTPHALEVEA